jgi:transposase
MTKQYDKEYKMETVRLIEKEGKTAAQVAREMEIPVKTLYRWVSEYKSSEGKAFPGSGRLKPEDQATRDLQKQMRDLKEENEILKKAMHFFAKDRH